MRGTFRRRLVSIMRSSRRAACTSLRFEHVSADGDTKLGESAIRIGAAARSASDSVSVALSMVKLQD